MSWKNDTAQKNPRLFLWSSVIGGMDFSRSLFLVYFLSAGFTGAQTGILQAALFWTTFALEIPSGILADKFGRKKSIVLGLLSLVATYLVLAHAHSFAVALIGFMLWGAGFAFISGAGSALLYDGLKESGKIETHLNWLARTRSFTTVGLGASILAGGFLYEWLPVSVFWASAVAATVGLALILPVPEPVIHETSEEHVGTVAALHAFFGDKNGRDLLIFLLGMAAIEMACTPFFIFSQTLFHSQGLSEKGISLVLGGGFLASSLAQGFSARARNIPVLVLVAGIGAVISLCLAALAWAPGLWAQIGLFAVINTLPSFLFVHTDQYVQDRCESRIRASLLSVQSFLNAVLIGLAYLGIGMMSDGLGMAKTLALLAAPVLVGIGLVTLHFSRTKR